MTTKGLNASNVGRLVGLHGTGDSRASINRSYATGQMLNSNETNVGGLVGYIVAIGSGTRGIVSTGYATSAVSGSEGSDRAGGLVGQTYSGGIITASYAIGEVRGPADVGGMVGQDSTYPTAETVSTIDFGIPIPRGGQ